MSTEQPGQRADRPPRGPRDKKAQGSYLVIGIVFVVVAISMSFGDSSAWVVFLILGITFLAMSGTKQYGRKPRPGDAPEDAP
ncbi:hypothetical protein [Tessaracoccus antarcticus]|uniref:Uncharacterized protein n=1 Tax=Tessaracoccus antarcticus TaxID=2479848 RepID=A0A3M0G4N9_9ACTN|nr:hypothetical protein [Tessaracoccus antarcticus]RMB59970.1 hypothetical protein EAX62_09600 [Tessaracoccus antarcticus]